MQFCNFNFSPQMTFLLSLFSECLCHLLTNFVIVQSLSCVRLFGTSCTAARQACLSFTISQNLLKLMSIESSMDAINHLILCRPLTHYVCEIIQGQLGWEQRCFANLLHTRAHTAQHMPLSEIHGMSLPPGTEEGLWEALHLFLVQFSCSVVSNSL